MKGILFLSFNFCLILLQFRCINSGNTQQNITQIKTQDSLILMQNLQDLACNKLVEYDKLTGLPEDKLTAVSGELCSSSIMIALEKFEIAKGEDDLVRRRSFILKNILKRVLDSCGKIDVQWRKECLSNFEPIYSKVMSNLNRPAPQPVQVDEYSMTNPNTLGGFIAVGAFLLSHD